MNIDKEDPTWTEADRLAALARYRILDTPPEAAFDDLALLAAELCAAKSAAIVFIDRDRQWVKASVNIDEKSRPRDEALCARAITHAESLVIENLADEPLTGGKIAMT